MSCAPYVDLSIGMNWHSAAWFGGQYRYGVYFRNMEICLCLRPIGLVRLCLQAQACAAGIIGMGRVGGSCVRCNISESWPVDDLERVIRGVIEVFVLKTGNSTREQSGSYR
jgi:hypothetical protein